MFDIGWLELLVIAVVAIVVVGPKDLPRLMRTFGHYAGKVRRMASDFQRQFDQVMTDAELEEMQRRYQEAVERPERVKGPPMLPVPEEARAHPQNRQKETAEAPSENATAAPKSASKRASRKSSPRPKPTSGTKTASGAKTFRTKTPSRTGTAGSGASPKTGAAAKPKAASTAKRQPKTSASATKAASPAKSTRKTKSPARKSPASTSRKTGQSKERSS